MDRLQPSLHQDDSASPGDSGGRAIRRRSLHRHVTDRLRDMIVEGELTAGARIDEKALCDLFEISRTPLREALKVLAAEGLVELLPNRGARVATLTERDIVEMFEVVSGIEFMAADLAVRRASDEAIGELRRIHDRMVRYHAARRRSDYFRLNHQIHNTVIGLSGNALLVETHAQLMTKIRRARFAAILSQERWDQSMREHEALMCALEARDPAAGTILRDHVLETGETVLKFLREDSQAANERRQPRRQRKGRYVSAETRQTES